MVEKMDIRGQLKSNLLIFLVGVLQLDVKESLLDANDANSIIYERIINVHYKSLFTIFLII